MERLLTEDTIDGQPVVFGRSWLMYDRGDIGILKDLARQITDQEISLEHIEKSLNGRPEQDAERIADLVAAIESGLSDGPIGKVEVVTGYQLFPAVRILRALGGCTVTGPDVHYFEATELTSLAPTTGV